MISQPQYTKAVLYEKKLLPGNIIILQLAPESWIDYQAGQYLAIEHQGINYFYSIANVPDANQKLYELHIRVTDGAKRWLDAIDHQADLAIHLPYGTCHMENIGFNKPLVLIAGGMGFAPIKAILDYLASLHTFSLPIELYWSGRSSVDFYMEDRIKFWQIL